MKPSVRAVPFFVSAFALLFAIPAPCQDKTKPPKTYPELPSEIPAEFKPVTDSFDHTRRAVKIPMRDGVTLHTVILIPKGAKKAPILLTRTPYSADKLTSHADSSHLGPVLSGYDNAVDVIVEGGYIRVVQDVRGKHGSEGDYVVNRPLRGPLNKTPVDHATDTYDTIDWLVKNVPETNGKVGILGISYNGFLPLMALVNPHPALKVSVPMNPMVDGWMGDDWFHYGAFRQLNVSWIYNQVATRKGDEKWWRSHYDEYDMWMQAISAGELGKRRGMDKIGFWNKLVEHPAYDAFWQGQAMDKALAAQPLKTPVMLVHSLWDQEDIYGAPAVYKAIEPKDTKNDKVFLVIGPWHPGQMIGAGSARGHQVRQRPRRRHFRKKILARFSLSICRTALRRPTSPRSPPSKGRARTSGAHCVGLAAENKGRQSRQDDAALPARSEARTSTGPMGRPHTKSTSPIRPSPSRSSAVPCHRWATRRATRGHAGSSTISAKPPDAPTS
ncbi:MAG: CocE/NonD family hydrolase [Gemmataceae bacterium]